MNNCNSLKFGLVTILLFPAMLETSVNIDGKFTTTLTKINLFVLNKISNKEKQRLLQARLQVIVPKAVKCNLTVRDIPIFKEDPEA